MSARMLTFGRYHNGFDDGLAGILQSQRGQSRNGHDNFVKHTAPRGS